MLPSLRFALAALAVLVLAGPADGQTRIPRCFSTDTFMPSMFEDRDGYLWVGTGNGVLRFDGSEPPEYFWPEEGLPAGPVWAIRQRQDGTLYFGTERGAALRTGESFRSPPELGLQTGRVRAIAPGPQGSLFFGHRHEVVKLHANGRTERISLGLPAKTRSSVHSLLWSRDGTLYAGTMGGEVIALRQGRPVPVPLVEGFRPGEIRAIHERRDGTLYFGTRWGLAILREGVLQRPSEVRDIVQAITEGRDGTLYVGTTEGLWISRGSPEKFEAFTVEQGLADNRIESVLETRGGNVYIGTNRGLCVYQQDLFQSWTQRHGLDRSAISVTADPEGRILVGTDRGLFVLQDGIWKPPGRENEIPFGVILALQADSEGALHLGMGDPRGGAYILDNGVVREIPLDSPRRRGAIAAIHRAHDGNIYLGGHGGLFVLRDGAASLLYDQDGVLAIDSSPDGSIWFGTFEQGLIRYRNGAFQRWTQENGLTDNRVDSVTVGRGGRIYAATIRGLSIFHKGRFRKLSRSDGLSTNVIRCTLEGKDGLIYVHTDDGIAIVDPEARPGTPAVLRNLSMEDGLVSREGNRGACYQDAEGRLWFGSSRGITRYDPQKEPAQRKPPAPRLSGWRLFDERKPLPIPGEVPRLSGRENYYLTFNFAGIDLATPHHVRYRYRLTGLETDWTRSRERQARYTNLGPGDYRFEIQASNRPGVWSAPVTLPFQILPPPWWRRPQLMMTLSAGVILASLALVAGLRVRQLLAIERLRTTLAAELHDHIGTGLTEIAIVSELVARRDGGASSELAQVGETARRLVDRMNDIVWLVNPRRDSLHELVTRLKSSYAELFATAGVSFETGDLSSLEGIHLSMAYRENLYALLKEGLHNALRHSGCSRVRLDVAFKGRELEATVRDDGQGFETGGEETGNGLGNMRRRAAALGGRLTVESTGGQGTAIRFTGPVRGKSALDLRRLSW